MLEVFAGKHCLFSGLQVRQILNIPVLILLLTVNLWLLHISPRVLRITSVTICNSVFHSSLAVNWSHVPLMSRSGHYWSLHVFFIFSMNFALTTYSSVRCSDFLVWKTGICQGKRELPSAPVEGEMDVAGASEQAREWWTKCISKLRGCSRSSRVTRRAGAVGYSAVKKLRVLAEETISGDGQWQPDSQMQSGEAPSEEPGARGLPLRHPRRCWGPFSSEGPGQGLL